MRFYPPVNIVLFCLISCRNLGCFTDNIDYEIPRIILIQTADLCFALYDLCFALYDLGFATLILV